MHEDKSLEVHMKSTQEGQSFIRCTVNDQPWTLKFRTIDFFIKKKKKKKNLIYRGIYIFIIIKIIFSQSFCTFKIL